MRRGLEAWIATVFALLTLADVGLGLLRPPVSGVGAGAMMRFVLTAGAVVALVAGPGFVLAKIRKRQLGEWLGFSMLPGIGLLAATGLLAWLLAGHVRPQSVCAVIATIVAVLVLVFAGKASPVYGGWDRDALLVAGLLFLLCAGRALYSVDPIGDLYRGTVSQTNDASRPDSRIPFHVVQLIANGVNPWTALGEQNFRPYDFSSRGPLAGLAATPIVLIAGARPDLSPDFQPWAPFDAQGFMPYKLAMEGFAAFSLLIVYGLARRFLAPSQSLFCLVVTALTPFIIHETFFTWPKLLAAALVIAGAHALIRGWPLPAGLLAGAGYLAHPLALLAVPTLLLLLLTRLTPAGRAGWRSGLISGAAVLIGVLIWVGGWRTVNGSQYTQGGFLTYLTGPPPLLNWVTFRIASMLSTLLPLWSGFTRAGRDIFYDSLQGRPVPASIRVAINYSCALSMAIGLLFSPLFFIAMWRAFRRAPLLVTVVAVLPLLLFWIYWGASQTGLVREGLQPWVLSLLLLYAWVRPRLVQRWRWWSHWERPLLLSRAVESLFLLVGPSILTTGAIVSRRSDIPALLLIAIGIAGLSVLTWKAGAPQRDSDEPLAMAAA